MTIPKKIINFLEKNKIRYQILEHKTVYTAFDKSQTLKIKPNIIGKTLVLKANKELIIVLIPANKNLDKQKVKKIINKKFKKEGKKLVKTIDFASERLMKNKLKGVKIGAIPPFGNLFGFTNLINRSLLGQSKIIINSGDCNQSLKIKGVFLKKLMPDLVAGSFIRARK